MFDTERFISLVEARPCLWKISDAKYHNRDENIKCWQEICVEMFLNWDSLDAAEKTEKGKELQKKWKNLKDRFIKDMKVQKDVPSGSAASKKKKYIFADIMQFLLPELKDRSTDTNIPETDIGTHDMNDSENISKEDEASGEVVNVTPVIQQKTTTYTPKSRPKQTFEQQLIGLLERNQAPSTPQEEDEDLAFFKSLLPAVRKFTDYQKTEFRLEVLKSMRKIQTISLPVPQNIHSYPPSYSQPLQQSEISPNPSIASWVSQSLNLPRYTNQVPIQPPQPSPATSVSALSPTESQMSQYSDLLDIYNNLHALFLITFF